MERQIITVDIAPGNSQVERLGSSQGDIGRPLGVYIIQNGVALDCSAYSAELYILKPDGKFYTTQATVDATATNLIKWDTAEQETPVAGACAAQIRITAGDDDIGTARFVEFVEASPCDMGAASESEVALLTEYVHRARESATSAGRDATTASDAASSASGSASTATTAANTATKAATAATTAADRAEAVEESIPADYTQLSDDVTGLKSAVSNIIDFTGTTITRSKTIEHGSIINATLSLLQVDVPEGYTVSIKLTDENNQNHTYALYVLYEGDVTNTTLKDNCKTGDTEYEFIMSKAARCFSVYAGGMTNGTAYFTVSYKNVNAEIAQKLNTAYQKAEYAYNAILPPPSAISPSEFVQGTLYLGSLDRNNTKCVSQDDYNDIPTVNDGVILISETDETATWISRITFFNESKTYLSQVGYAEQTSVPIPNGAKYYKASISRLVNGVNVDTTPNDIPNNTIYIYVSADKLGQLTQTTQELEARFKTFDTQVRGDYINIKRQTYVVNQSNIVPPRIGQITVSEVDSYQGFTFFNGVFFQLYNQNAIALINNNGELISQLEIASGHGNTICFSNDYYSSGDEFPLAYIYISPSPSKTGVFRITRSGTELIKTIVFPADPAGYYADCVIDTLNRIIYSIGYKTNSYTSGTNNAIIICKWALDNMTDNGDGTFTPNNLGSFEIPFVPSKQGSAIFDNKIFIVSSLYGNPNTTIYAVDVDREKFINVISDLPTAVKNTETQGICFVPYGEKYNAMLNLNSIGASYYEIKFSE